MKEIFMLLILLIVVPVASFSCSDKKSNEQDLHSNSVERINNNNQNPMPDSESSLASKKHPTPCIPREPITQEYFDDFMESTLSFSQFRLTYFMSANEEHPDAREQFFTIHSPIKMDNSTFALINQILSEITMYESHYIDLDTDASYDYELSTNLVSPIFQIMQTQGVYYFNAEEFAGEPSRVIGIESSFGHINYISMTFEETQLEAFDIPPHKTLCKGWDPGDDPPAELMPLIAYLESVIIPEMRQHPYP
jgi:hypothetical protein